MTDFKITALVFRVAHDGAAVNPGQDVQPLAEKAAAMARVTGSVGATHTETLDGVEISVTVWRAK